jgi:hypothetical protein
MADAKEEIPVKKKELESLIVEREMQKGYAYWKQQSLEDPITYDYVAGKKAFQVEVEVLEQNEEHVQVSVSVSRSPQFWPFFSLGRTFICRKGEEEKVLGTHSSEAEDK